MRYMQRLIKARYAFVLVLMYIFLSDVSAQDSLYVYHHGGHTDSLCMSKVMQISHSRLDLDNVRHDDYVVMSVSFSDASVRQYLLATLDSVVMVRGTERYPLVCFSGSMAADAQSRQKAPRRTSLDGDFMSKTGDVDFYWTEGDKIYVQNNNMGYVAADSVEISDSHRSADFFFKNAAISGEDIVVYYPGQTAGGYNQVRVAKNQSQQQPNNTAHIGVAGDCGTAVATKAEGGQSYRFELEHKASYLCFLPYIANDLSRTVLKKITVRSDSAIAGVFTLDPTKAAIVPKSDTTHVITLTTGGESGFVLPQGASQNISAYMVIAPQNGSSRLTCEFTVYDTALQSEGVFTKTVDLPKIEPNMVYVVKANCNNYVVDLGLPVKFLNHNMGAFAPEEYGGYFAYGELNDKGNYTTGNYTYQNTPHAEIANIRLTDKDVAHVRLGGNFSVPTSAELNMLKDSCTWSWQSSFNGTPGYKITGKNGNVLFLPAAGYRSGTSNSDINSRGCYRSSQLIASGQKKNWYLNFYSTSHNVELSGEDIYLGESIRPVVTSGMQMTDGTSVLVMTDSVQWKATQLTSKLFGTVYGISKAKTPVEIGFVVGSTEDVTVDNGTKIAAAATNADGKYSADFQMPKDTCYYYRAYAKDQDGNIDYGNAIQFGRAYIDLGLPSGTKWANLNIGATRPEEDGGYYTWGETITKSSYGYGNYKWWANAWLFPEYGLRDTQATRHDVASKNWKGNWMLPNKEEIQELLTYCSFTSTTLNGVKGYLVESNFNHHKIFMPFAGWRRDGNLNYYNEQSYIQSSEVRDSRNDYAWDALNGTRKDDWYHSDGIAARPVWKTNAKADDGTPMYVRTLSARKSYDGTTEADTLRGVIRGAEQVTGNNTTYGFRYWKHGDVEHAVTLSATPDADGHISYVVNTGLEPGVTYHYAACIDNGTVIATGDTLDITAVGLVDLGLSVKWANVNLGAESEGAGGDFYRWGATVPYRCVTQQYLTAKDITPESGYDIVTNLWGENYRMPTKAEYQELIDNTTPTWTTRNGYKGYLFTSKKENYTDRSIFIPASGYYYDTYHNDWNANADYWTSTVNGSGSAYDLNFTSAGYWGDGVPSHEKHHGFSVRAVQDHLAYLETCNIGRNVKNDVEIDTLKAYVKTISGTPVNVGFEYSENADMTDAIRTLPISVSKGYFSYPLSSGLQKGKVYYYRAYATDDNINYQYGKVFHFELLDYVDLGLPSGTLWATINVGANASECYGDYFAYGETKPKDSYTQANSLTYNKEQGYNIAGTEFDAATVNWGQLWCSPTKDQFEELRNSSNCSWQDVTINGYNCIKITSKKTGYTDKYILIPKGGRMDGTSYTASPGDHCVYAPSTRYSTTDCYDFYARSYNDHWIGSNRKFYGYPMRPVMMKGVQSLVNGVMAKVKTEGIDWQWNGDNTTAAVKLIGNVMLSGSVAYSFGFVIGSMQDVEATTPDVANEVTVNSKDADNRFEYTMPSYDGTQKFFRAFLKVGDQYYFGDIKTITAADLLAADFRSDGTAFNGTFTPFTTATKNGTANVAYNAEHHRYEADFSANAFNGQPNYWYSFYYNDGITYGDFWNRLADGHSLEVFLKAPEATSNEGESNAFASYETGGSGLGIRGKQIYTQVYANNQYYDLQAGPMTDVGGWDKYYHVVVVWDKANGKFQLYVDGVNKKEKTTAGDFRLPSDGSRYYLIGAEPGGTSAYSAWNGKVVYARIYDAALTSDQVLTLYRMNSK